MDNQIYHRLREKVDTYMMGFPATPSGVEIEILQKLFTPDEAEVGLNLSMMPEPAEVIAARMNRDSGELAKVLAEMVRKGTIFTMTMPEGVTCYSGAPYMHGLAENQAGNMDPELARLYEKYEVDGYLKHMGEGVPPQTGFRYIPISETLSPDWVVAPYNKSEDLFKSKQKIAAIPCYCRDKHIALGGSTDLPTSNACFLFNWLADYAVERGQGKYVTVDEALAIQKECEEAGLVNMPTNLQDSFAMCHCDGESCVAFRALKRLPKPAEAVVSDYYTQVIEADCNGCEVCIEWCPMDAILDTAVGTVEINLDRCIGCGVCISRCVMEALQLLEKPEEQKKPITVMEYVTEIAKFRELKARPMVE